MISVKLKSRSNCKAIEFRLDAVAARGEYYRHLCALQQAGGLSVAQQCDGLVEHVAALNLGEENSIGLTVDGRLNALVVHALVAQRCLKVERTVNNAVAELAIGGFLLDYYIVGSAGEMALVNFLGAVDKRNLGLLDVQGMGNLSHIFHLLDALINRWAWYNCGIGEEQQAMKLWNVGNGDMSEHITLRQNACFLVENGTKQVVGVQQTFHQHVGAVFTNLAHCLGGGIVAIGSVDDGELALVLSKTLVGFDFLAASHKSHGDNTSLEGF